MPISKAKRVNYQNVKKGVKQMLYALGYDLTDSDLKGTPERVAKTLTNELQDVTEGGVKKLFQVFPSVYESMIVLRGHETQTRCPHHLERVTCLVSVGYIPKGRLIGLSKLARIADYFSRGLMLQEEIAELIVNGLMEALKPLGVAVYIEAAHNCMQARGVKTDGIVVTSKLAGVFLEDSTRGLAAREEFFFMVGGRK